jgi:hypothetical protein
MQGGGSQLSAAFPICSLRFSRSVANFNVPCAAISRVNELGTVNQKILITNGLQKS